jgi:hypothetical protein
MSNVFHLNPTSNLSTPQGPIDDSGKPPYDGRMVSHYELDAKLEAIEARADARMSRFEERMDQAIQEMQRDRVEIKAEMAESRKEFRAMASSMRTTVIVTGATSVIAIVLGVAAFNATVLSNMVASFESGKNTADAIAKAADQLRQAQELTAKKK